MNAYAAAIALAALTMAMSEARDPTERHALAREAQSYRIILRRA